MPPRPRAPSSAANSIAAEMGAQGIPSRGCSPPPSVTTKHEASGTGEAPVRSTAPEGSDCPVEEKNSPEEIPWYDKLEDIDEDYRKFLSCVRFVNGHQIVVVPEGGLDAVPARVGDKSGGAGKNDCGVGKKEKGKGKVPAVTTGGPALKSRVGDCTAHPQKGQKEKNNGKKNGAKKMKVAEKEENPSAEPHLETLNTALGKEKLVVTTTGEPALKSRVRDSTTHPRKKEKNGRKNGSKKMKVAEKEGKPSKELPVETLNIVKRKRKSSDVQNAESHTASELHGVVWPTHIMERPDSEFKEKLMCLLREPFSQEEYDTLLDKATTRLPATMKRQTRRGVKYYNSKHEWQPSYFDTYPDLAKQVRVESTSKPNQLALLRGFFFWMKYIVHHDQFRPWTDDFKQYKVTMIEIE